MRAIFLSALLVISLISCQNNDSGEEDSNNYIQRIENKKSAMLGLSTQLNQSPEDTADFIHNDGIFRRMGAMNDELNDLVIEAYGQVPTDSLLKAFDGFIPYEVYIQMSEEELSTELGQKLMRSRQQFDQMSAQLKTLEGRSICDSTSSIAMKICDQLEGRTLILFSASWCAPCLSLEPKFEKLVSNRGERIIEVDLQDHPLGHYVHDMMSQTSWERHYDGSRFWSRFGIPGVPFVIIVNSQGFIQQALNPEEVEFLVQESDSEKYSDS
jgi:thiol-disulfide isomerase/thioredoxin